MVERVKTWNISIPELFGKAIQHHLPAQPRWLVPVLRPVVQSFVLPVVTEFDTASFH